MGWNQTSDEFYYNNMDAGIVLKSGEPGVRLGAKFVVLHPGCFTSLVTRHQNIGEIAHIVGRSYIEARFNYCGRWCTQTTSDYAGSSRYGVRVLFLPKVAYSQRRRV